MIAILKYLMEYSIVEDLFLIVQEEKTRINGMKLPGFRDRLDIPKNFLRSKNCQSVGLNSSPLSAGFQLEAG